MDRRTFLGVSAAVLALGGCTAGPADPAPPPAPHEADDPDAAVRAAVAASEIALIGAYRDLIAREPRSGAQLGPLLAHHEQHLALVAPGMVASRVPAPSATQGLPLEGSPVPSGSPAAAGTSLVDLVRAEQAAVDQRTGACDSALGAVLARNLCLIAASEAQHVEVLSATLAAEEG